MMRSQPVQIVAEAAQGYEGNPTLARMLVRAAAAAGADMVKFQLVYADELALPSYRWYELFQGLEMSAADWDAVRREADQLGIGLVFDVFGRRSLEQAAALGARALKIHATDFFNHGLVEAALRSGLGVHVSLGGIEMDELAAFLERHRAAGSARAVLLCGYQAEPTPLEQTNVARLAGMRERFPGQPLGFMDHADADADEGQWLGLLALPYGVEVIEKHITLDRALKLEDSVSALSPAEFARYVQRLRAAERALGDAGLALSAEERAYRGRALKAVVTTTVVPAGARLSAAVLDLRRAAPGDGGVEPLRRMEDAVGRTARRELPALAAVFGGDLD